MLETYITHIKITEFSSYPTSPPPPQARTPDSEKPRVIIVAVRKSGRVRMHKSKENATGTFSIGKTWNLDDLSHIESYTGPHVSSSHREWGGDTGFLVTLGKPYFWQAQTDKEKKFFIASLIKIYGKYTGGKSPELSGFDQRELDQVLGAGRRQAGAPPRPPVPEPSPSQQGAPSAASAALPVPAIPPPSIATEPPRFQKPQAGRSPLNGANSPAASFDSVVSRERPPAPPWTAQNNKSQDSVANSFATSDTSSIPPRSRNGLPGAGAFGRFADSREPSEPPQEALPPPPPPQMQREPPQMQREPPQMQREPPQMQREPPQMQREDRPPPERRRPPMDPSRPQDRDLVPPPLMSPITKREPVAPPPRSTARKDSGAGQQPVTPSVPSGFKDRDAPLPVTAALDSAVRSESPMADPPRGMKSASNTSLPITSAAETPPPAETPPVPELPDEEMRPGLGPMIKAKRSRGDIAGALWKAASAASAGSTFRPRPGGAGDRLRQAKVITSEGPDGITGVVPAPPRPASRDLKPATPPIPEVPKRAERGSAVPEVKLTVPNASRPTSLEAPPREVKQKEEHRKEEPRRSVVTGNDAKYLQSLGIDPGLLDERSEEFGKWLDFFGWVPGEKMRARGMDDMKTDIERELNKAQAGGWLSRFQDEDERVNAIKLGIDLAISECEEMDNLLTLYSVELSVRRFSLPLAAAFGL